MSEPINLGKFEFDIDLHIKPIIEQQSQPPPVYYQQQCHPVLWVLLTVMVIVVGFLAYETFFHQKPLLVPVPYGTSLHMKADRYAPRPF